MPSITIRLATLAENFTGTTNDQSVTFSYSPASQITSLTKTNDIYAWTGHGNGSTASVANGLNQLSSIGGTATAHDARGNVTSDPMTGKTYGYSSENLLTSASGGVTLGYDPQLRLYQLAGGTTTRFAYDGLAMIAEYDGSNALLRRFVHGPSVDEPLVHYEGSGTLTRSWLHADERGSVIALSDGSGNVTTINKYDEYGKPQATNAGRFQYTGQMWLSEIGAYYYKARIYSPVFGGRFLQTDPIGYDGGLNLYAYVLNNPIGFADPLGLKETCLGSRIKQDSCANSPDPVSCVGSCAGFYGLTAASQQRMTPEELRAAYDSATACAQVQCTNLTLASQQFFPNTSVGNIPTDAEGYRLVGAGTISPAISSEGQTFEIFPTDTSIKVSTYSEYMAGMLMRFWVTPLGSIELDFGHSGSVLAPVIYRNWFTSYFRIPTGLQRVTVLPTHSTPRFTDFVIRAR